MTRRRPRTQLAALAVAAALVSTAGVAAAQTTGPAAVESLDALRPASSRLTLTAASASSWSQSGANVVLLRGGEAGVTITAGEATLTAPDAVVWLVKPPGQARTRVDVVLLGQPGRPATITTPVATRTGPELAADLVLEGSLRFDVPLRQARDEGDSPEFARASPLRPEPAEAVPETAAPDVPQISNGEAPAGAVVPPRVTPVRIVADELTTRTDDEGKLAVLATGGVFLFKRNDDGGLIELRAERAVVFTTLDGLAAAGDFDPASVEQAVSGVYLEGDVRVSYTPADGRGGTSADREQRLEAESAFYDLIDDRATLTRAVLHTSEPALGQPISLRAQTIRQLSVGRYEARSAEVSTSRMAVPDYSLNASRVFVRTGEAGGGRTIFGGDNLTARAFGVPAFYFPLVRGASIDNRLPLRSVGVGQSRNLGLGVETQWGLFETLGATPPKTLDATYSIDYFSERGLAGGINADYRGDLILPGDSPANFFGDLEVYGVDDHGVDDLGGGRRDIPRDGFRGRAFFEHQHFFDDGVSAQLRAGYASDETFIEEWRDRQFENGPPHDLFFNVEQSRGNALLAVTADYDVNNFATVAGALQENVGVQRLPEVGFARFGERLGPAATFTSRNRVGALRFKTFEADLDDYGLGGLEPGLPGYAYTGVTDDFVARGDFRQEVTLPLDVGPLRVVPFLVGRATAYSQDTGGEAALRLLGGVGAHLSTLLTASDDRVYSRLLDVDRLRHVVEPGLSLFASAANVERDELFIYDPGVDGVSDISAAQFSLRQRLQTRRGPPGRKRSVDVVALNVEANYFANEPVEPAGGTSLGIDDASGFRGLYFAGEPEASLARDGLNADALWRVSDTTALVGDAAYNLDADLLATAAAGVVVQRDERVRYSVGGRYLGPADLTLLVGRVGYKLSERYALAASANYDLDERDVRNSRVTIERRFDRFAINVGLYLDRIEDEGGVRVNIYPLGIPGVSTDVLGDFARIGGD